MKKQMYYLITSGLLKCELHILRKTFLITSKYVEEKRPTQRTRNHVECGMDAGIKDVLSISRSYQTSGNCLHISDKKYK